MAQKMRNETGRASLVLPMTVYTYSVKLHLRHKRTKRQTDRRQESNLVHF